METIRIARFEASSADGAPVVSDSEERFRIMADSSPLMIWVTDVSGSIEFVNRAYCQFVGIGTNGKCARQWQEVLHPEDAATYIDAFFTAIRHQSPFHAEARMRRADGEWRWVASYGAPRFSAEGDFLGIVGSSPDVTDRIAAEQQLRISEARYRTLVEGSSALIVHCGADGALTWISPSVFEFTGSTETALAGYGWTSASVIHPDDYAGFVDGWHRAVANSSPWQFELRIRRSDGAYRWHLGSLRPVFGEGNNVVEWVGIATDEHDRKQTEEKLRESEHYFRVALHDSPIFVFTTDRDLRYTWTYNATGGFSAAEILGRTPAEIMGEKAAEPLERFAGEILSTGRPARAQIEFPSSELGIWEMWGEPRYDANGAIIGLIAAGMNVTGLTHALRDAEEANRTRDRSLAMISHELRTPMTSIVGWTSLLAADAVSPDMMPVVLRSLQASCRMLQKLVDDLLDLTRLMNDRVVLHLRPLDLAEIVRDAVAAILPSAEQKGVRLRSTLPPSPILVGADSQRMHQILSNLLSNAVKFTDAGGEIDVSVKFAHGRAELMVRDTGKGISSDFLPQVFDRFTQEESGGGLGLGLSIVRELVERHGGIISAESEGPGCGAAFTVLLPAVTP